MQPSRIRFALIATSLLALSGACGGRSTIDFGLPTEGTGATNSGGSAGVGGSGGQVGGFGGTSVGATGGGGGIVDGGAGGADGGAGGIVGCLPGLDDCQMCTCQDCYAQWTGCNADNGCTAIVACARANGCTGVQCYIGPCQQVINQNGGPFGNSATLAQQLGQCSGQNNCPCAGGSGGSGGTGAGGTGAGGGGGTGGGIVGCVQCIAQQCPAVQQCLFDTACRNGAICAMQQCVGGGGGTPSLQCVLGCFNGDFQAAFQAFQAFQCFFTNCGQQCGGVIPGLPGGNGGGFPGFGGTGGG